jgi:hypothetical protein
MFNIKSIQIKIYIFEKIHIYKNIKILNIFKLKSVKIKLLQFYFNLKTETYIEKKQQNHKKKMNLRDYLRTWSGCGLS